MRSIFGQGLTPRLIPLVIGKINRRLSNRLKAFSIPLRHRLIRYPDPPQLLHASGKSRFYFVAADRERLIREWRESFNFEADIISAADTICDHVFDLLGSGPTHLGERINWHTDFKCDRSWPSHRPLSAKDVYAFGQRADIKVPWELSRCQHLSTLGKAYWLTGDERYAEEFISQISSWLEDNPWGYGPNWTCAMDVAIRAANWILAHRFFEDSPRYDDAQKEKVARSLWEHGVFLEQNLERGAINSNHYISDLAGLFSIGVFFSGIARARRWRDFALTGLFNEMRRQVLDDGVTYEKSTSYHRLVLELFTYSFVLARANGLEIPSDVESRWRSMFDFVAAYTKPDGTVAQIGDSDDGMLHKLHDRTFLDHRYLLGIAAICFDSADFAAAAGEFPEEAFWVLGSGSREKFEDLRSRTASAPASRAFEASGFYVMRSDRLHVIIDAGDNGMEGLGAHAHNDTLSFELYAIDKTFIVDPGSYLYTADPELRNYFRSTACHNTVQVDSEEIHPINARWLFALPDAGGIDVTLCRLEDDVQLLEAEHYAYRRLREPVTHRRRIEFDRNAATLTIQDNFEGSGEHEFCSRLHFAPGIGLAEVPGATGSFVTVCEGAVMSIDVHSEADLDASVEDGWCSPSYGIRMPIKVIAYTWRASAPCRFEMILTGSEPPSNREQVASNTAALDQICDE